MPDDAIETESNESIDSVDELYRTTVRCPWYMLSPDGGVRASIDICFSILVFVELVVLPMRIAYNLAFDSSSGSWRIYNVTMCALFLVDIASNLLTGYVDFGKIIFDPVLTVSRYLRTWGTLDIVASATNLGMSLDVFSKLPDVISRQGLSGREIALLCLLRLFPELY